MDIGSVLTQWQTGGVFEFLLPFLLVFAVVFGILTTTHILGKNRAIHVIIAFVIGLMAIGYSNTMGFSLGQFMQTLFPRLGVGISIIVAILILVGLFIPDDNIKYWMWGLSAIGFVIAIIIVAQTFDALSFFSFSSASDFVGWIVGGVLLIGLIIAVATSGSSTSINPKAHVANWAP